MPSEVLLEGVLRRCGCTSSVDLAVEDVTHSYIKSHGSARIHTFGLIGSGSVEKIITDPVPDPAIFFRILCQQIENW
jgi:hypothetical protein